MGAPIMLGTLFGPIVLVFALGTAIRQKNQPLEPDPPRREAARSSRVILSWRK
jgi:hypothetical protein